MIPSATPRPVGTVDVSESGGTTELIAHHGDRLTRPVLDDLSLLASGAPDVPELGELTTERRFSPGEVIAWHYGRATDVVRVLRDDDRGLVCWLPGGSPRITMTPVGAAHLRDIPLEARATRERAPRLGEWHGTGVLRLAPAGKAWSVWWFYREDGTPWGAYCNLELPHVRAVAHPALVTRDLTLDVWIDEDGCWLKDADELAAGVAAGACSAAQADLVHRLATDAAVDLMAGHWTMDAEWERMPTDPQTLAPVTFPDDPLVAATLAVASAESRLP